MTDTTRLTRRSLLAGAAALPLLERFLVGQDAFLKDN